MKKLLAVLLLIASFAIVSAAQGTQTAIAFETAMQKPVVSLDGALWALADASRGTCGSQGETPTCNAVPGQYQSQLATAEWDALELKWILTKEEMWAEGVNHTQDTTTDADFAQPFLIYHTATCAGVTFDADTNAAAATQCDMKNATVWVAAVESDIAALPAKTTSAIWNGSIATAQKDIASLTAQWTAAQMAAQALPLNISFPSSQVQMVLYESANMIFQMGVGGCDVTLAKIKTTGAANQRIQCGHVAAMALEKMTFQPSAAIKLDQYFNLTQNCIFESVYMAAVEASFMGTPGAEPETDSIEYATEPTDKTPYRMETDDSLLATMQTAEILPDTLLILADRFDSTGWHATDAMCWKISLLIWPEIQ